MKCEFEACRHMLSLTQVDFLLLSDAYSLLSSEPGRLGGFQYPTLFAICRTPLVSDTGS